MTFRNSLLFASTALTVALGLLAAWSGLWLGMRMNRHR